MAERQENAQNQTLWTFLAAVVRLQTRPFVGLALSPGFTPRPLLSATPAPDRLDAGGDAVAGVYAPAFVERDRRVLRGRIQAVLSPGFTPRPLLSGDQPRAGHH